MKQPAAAIMVLLLGATGALALAQVGPVWVRLVGGAGIMFLLLMITSQLAGLSENGEEYEDDGEILFEDRTVDEDSEESESQWRH